MDALFDQIADCLRADEKVTIAALAVLRCVPASPRLTPTPRPRSPAVWSPPPSPLQGQRPFQAEAGSRPCRRSERGRDRLSAYIPDPTAEPCPKRARLFLRADKRRVSWYTEQNKGRRIRSIKHAYSELQCSEAIHKAVERMGFAEMTEIQEKTIPVMLAGRDVIAKPHRHRQDLCLRHPGGGTYRPGKKVPAGCDHGPHPGACPADRRGADRADLLYA